MDLINVYINTSYPAATVYIQLWTQLMSLLSSLNYFVFIIYIPLL